VQDLQGRVHSTWLLPVGDHGPVQGFADREGELFFTYQSGRAIVLVDSSGWQRSSFRTKRSGEFEHDVDFARDLLCIYSSSMFELTTVELFRLSTAELIREKTVKGLQRADCRSALLVTLTSHWPDLLCRVAELTSQSPLRQFVPAGKPWSWHSCSQGLLACVFEGCKGNSNLLEVWNASAGQRLQAWLLSADKLLALRADSAWCVVLIRRQGAVHLRLGNVRDGRTREIPLPDVFRSPSIKNFRFAIVTYSFCLTHLW
jgi:hypothetical protein